jgi:hypothetical protein
MPAGPEFQTIITFTLMTLKLNKEIYPKKTIFKAIRAYKNLANFKLKERGKHFIVSGTAKLKDKELLRKEFLNFVLGSIKQ